MASRRLCRKPLTRANVANLDISKCTRQENLKINSAASHTFFSPCTPRRHSYKDNPANEGAAAPGGVSTRDLNAPNNSYWPVGTDLITVATQAFDLEMHLRVKAEELPGGTVLQQRTVEFREELRKCTFLERIKEMFNFEIENLRNKILKGASALYCI